MSVTSPEILVSEQDIEKRVKEIAAEISEQYADKGTLVLVGVLKGAFIFLADLSRHLTIPHVIEFIAVSSYGMEGDQSGAVRLVMDVRENIQGRDVLVVEDILDTGNTLGYLLELLRARKPASLKTCMLVRKTGHAQTRVTLDYLGFEIPNVWVVGYGLDYAEQYRTLPYIGKVEPN